MNPWARALHLFHEIAEFDATREVRRQQHERALQGLAEWYVHTEGLLLEALTVEIERRVAELGRLGLGLRVTAPSAPRLWVNDASLRFLSVGFEDEVVTAYSVRQAGHALMLHWAWQLRPCRGRFPRILSVPGIRVRRGFEEEMVLEAMSVPPGADRVRWALGDVAGEMLAMLAEAAASRRRLAV